MLQWGTPNDLETYINWSDYFKNSLVIGIDIHQINIEEKKCPGKTCTKYGVTSESCSDLNLSPNYVGYWLHVVQPSNSQEYEMKIRIVVARVKAEDEMGSKFFLFSTKFR